MNIEMYRMFFETQKKHWWFVTKKKIVLDAIERFLKKKHDIRILDMGCGSGLMLNALEAIGETYGMDMSDEAICFSREIFSGKLAKGSLPCNVPFEGQCFTLITALDLIEHVDLDVEALKTINARLELDGWAIITVPAYMFLWSKFDELNEHKRRYTLKELKGKLLQAGFIIEKISYYNTLLFPIVLIVRTLNRVFGRDGLSDVEVPKPVVNSILESIFGIEKYLLRILNMPFGVSVIAVVKKAK